MSRNTFPAFTILSAELSIYTGEVNATRTEQLRGQLEARDLDFVSAWGAYDGTNESNFIVLSDDGSREFELVLSLARRYGQQSVLHVDANRGATLVYVNTDLNRPVQRVPLGRFKQVSEHDAKRASGFTEVDGRYYTAVA